MHIDVVLLLIFSAVSVVSSGCGEKKLVYTDYVNDHANLLNPEQKGYLTSFLKDFHNRDSIWIMIVIEKSLNGKGMEDFMSDVFERSSLREMKSRRDLLIVMAVEDGQIQAMHGDGIHKKMLKLGYKEIVENDFLPSFSEGKYYEGLVKGVKDLIKGLEGPTTP